MKVGLAVAGTNPEVGVLAGGRVVYSNFSFQGRLREKLEEACRARGWEHDPGLDDKAAELLGRAMTGEDVFEWSVVGEKSRRVLQELRRVGKGETATYGELARRCGTGARAVGRIMNRNPFAPFVPCHKVVAKNGLGGFGSGLDNKRRMLGREGVRIPE